METLLGPLSLPRPQLGANQRSWPGCPLREPRAPEAYTPEPRAAPKLTAHQTLLWCHAPQGQ